MTQGKKNPSLISKVHDKVEAAEGYYRRIDRTCQAILALQKKSRLSPLWVALSVIGAFTLGAWLF